MSIELEAKTEDISELLYEVYNVPSGICEQVKNAFIRLEAIDNTKPSEAMKEIFNKVFDYGVQSVLDSLLLKGYNTKTMLEGQSFAKTVMQDLDESKVNITNLENIKTYILKVQEQEKENAKYKQLEEQLGCPLDLFVNLHKVDGLFCEIEIALSHFPSETVYLKIDRLGSDGIHFKPNEYDLHFIEYRYYKECYWLRKDKSE